MRTRVTVTEANHLLQPLAGLPVSLPWKGYGSAIFLELGEMAPLQHARRRGARASGQFGRGSAVALQRRFARCGGFGRWGAGFL